MRDDRKFNGRIWDKNNNTGIQFSRFDGGMRDSSKTDGRL